MTRTLFIIVALLWWYVSTKRDRVVVGAFEPRSCLVVRRPWSKDRVSLLRLATLPSRKQHRSTSIDPVVPSLLTRMSRPDPDSGENAATATCSRRFVLATAMFTAAATVTTQDGSSIAHAAAAAAGTVPAAWPPSTGRLSWETSPINKRSGVTAWDAEKVGYTVAFVTYLARFLLNFDGDCQQWWFSTKLSGVATTADQVDQFRLEQFAAFAASVAVGLQEYQDPDGPQQLLEALLRKYGSVPRCADTVNDTAHTGEEAKRQRRLARAARRQIALLFGLLEERQPVAALTKLLAAVDNGSVTSVQLFNESTPLLSGFEMGNNNEPVIEFPPPQAGDEGFERAVGRAVLRPTGRLLRLDIVDPGSGYKSPPNVTILRLAATDDQEEATSMISATAKAKIGTRGETTGSLVSVELTNGGIGYVDESAVQVVVSPPDSADGQTAVLKPILDMTISSIDIVKSGSGYAVEKPLKVHVLKQGNKGDSNQRILVGTSYPQAAQTSFTSFRSDSDKKRILDLEEKVYNIGSTTVSGSADGGATTTLPFWTPGKSSSAELLRMLPAGVGLAYDAQLKRYVLAIDADYVSQYPTTLLQSSTKEQFDLLR